MKCFGVKSCWTSCSFKVSVTQFYSINTDDWATLSSWEAQDLLQSQNREIKASRLYIALPYIEQNVAPAMGWWWDVLFIYIHTVYLKLFLSSVEVDERQTDNDGSPTHILHSSRHTIYSEKPAVSEPLIAVNTPSTSILESLSLKAKFENILWKKLWQYFNF